MKKLLFLTLSFVLALSISVTCLAAENTLSLSGAKGGAGQTLYLSLELNETVTANAIGISCQFDTTILEAVPELSTWERKGILSAFEQDNQGVWAAEKPEQLQGKLCVLAFRIKDSVAFDSTEILCAIVIKEGATEKVNSTVKSLITGECTHSYGSWESNGLNTHVRICSLCGGRNTQTHNWDSGVEETQADGKVLLIKTCNVCNAKNGTEITSTELSNSGLSGINHGTDDIHDHNSQTGNQEDHKHDSLEEDNHVHIEEKKDPLTIWIVVLLPIFLIVAAVLFVKKK